MEIGKTQLHSSSCIRENRPSLGTRLNAFRERIINSELRTSRAERFDIRLSDSFLIKHGIDISASLQMLVSAEGFKNRAGLSFIKRIFDTNNEKAIAFIHPGDSRSVYLSGRRIAGILRSSEDNNNIAFFSAGILAHELRHTEQRFLSNFWKIASAQDIFFNKEIDAPIITSPLSLGRLYLELDANFSQLMFMTSDINSLSFAWMSRISSDISDNLVTSRKLLDNPTNLIQPVYEGTTKIANDLIKLEGTIENKRDQMQIDDIRIKLGY